MIPFLVPLLLLMAAPFWESQPPKEWTDLQLEALLSDSPWAQMMPGPGTSAVPVNCRLALAAPVEQGEKELARRAALRTKPGPKGEEDPGALEYRLWLEDNRATQIILAIRLTSNQGLLDDREVRRME